MKAFHATSKTPEVALSGPFTIGNSHARRLVRRSGGIGMKLPAVEK